MEEKIENTKQNRSDKRLIALEVPEDLYQEIRKEAFEQCFSISGMIRLMIKNYFKNNNNC